MEPEITDDQIIALRNEACMAGDHELVITCNDALADNVKARRKCADIISYARGEINEIVRNQIA